MFMCDQASAEVFRWFDMVHLDHEFGTFEDVIGLKFLVGKRGNQRASYF